MEKCVLYDFLPFSAKRISVRSDMTVENVDNGIVEILTEFYKKWEKMRIEWEGQTTCH
jgi:hypothetical protein